MENVNDISTGLKIPSQVPLDAKTYFLNEAQLSNLGLSNNLVYTYYKGMLAYCAQENKTYRWREVLSNEQATPFLVSHFIYPNNWIVNGVDYSNKKYNFFLEETPIASPVPNPEQLAKIVSMSLHWKKGEEFVEYSTNTLPAQVTNNQYTRTGFIGYVMPSIDGDLLVHPDLPGTTTKPILIETSIYNLGVEIKNFDLIKNFKPTLVISKYTPTIKKKTFSPDINPETGDPYNQIAYRKGSFKIPAEVNNTLVRPTRILLNKKFQVIDFGQEHFFKTSKLFQNSGFIGKRAANSILETRGAYKRYSQVRYSHSSIEDDAAGFIKSGAFSHRSFVYLQFHLELTINDVKYLTEPLSRIKMEASISSVTEGTYEAGDIVTKEAFLGKIRFKHT